MLHRGAKKLVQNTNVWYYKTSLLLTPQSIIIIIIMKSKKQKKEYFQSLSVADNLFICEEREQHSLGNISTTRLRIGNILIWKVPPVS